MIQLFHFQNFPNKIFQKSKQINKDEMARTFFQGDGAALFLTIPPVKYN